MYYKLLVIACLIGNPKHCMVIENTEYPVVYETYEACKQRALVIGSEVNKYMPSYRAVKWRCAEVQEGRFL